jgi:hypothetical protein
MGDADGTFTHGTTNGYNQHGCHCEECTQAAVDYKRRLRAALRARRVLIDGRWIATEASSHGASTRALWGCQCETCRAAHRVTAAERRASKRAGT